MKHYPVLIVDDDQRHILDLAIAEFATDPRIKLWTAISRGAAETLLKTKFFQLALVDPRLDPNDDNSFEGTRLLEKIKELRPSCERVILTNLDRVPERGFEAILSQMHPMRLDAQGILIKEDILNRFQRLIGEKANVWLANPLEVDGADTVVKKLCQVLTGRNKPKTDITSDEIEFLVSRIFGQGESWNVGEQRLGIRRVALKLIPRQGFSPAAVVKATCYSSSDADDKSRGIWCALKFASRQYVEREMGRYSQYVRFRVEVGHRAELLGWQLGDNLGVLCYHFAGDKSLGNVFQAKNQAFFRVLKDLFSVDKKGWYKERGEIGLGVHFHANYGVDVVPVKELIHTTVHKLIRDFKGSLHSNQAILCGATLNLPFDIFYKAPFVQPSPTCVVHGDLHCDNILVSNDEKPMLIDYFSVASGPRAVDFAIIEGSVRLLHLKHTDADGNAVDDPRDDSEVIPEILGSANVEERAWNCVWGQDACSKTEFEEPSWSSASSAIGTHARENFPELGPEEYAATCLMWAMRLFLVKTMQRRKHVRLLMWMSNLVRVLKASA